MEGCEGVEFLRHRPRPRGVPRGVIQRSWGEKRRGGGGGGGGGGEGSRRRKTNKCDTAGVKEQAFKQVGHSHQNTDREHTHALCKISPCAHTKLTRSNANHPRTQAHTLRKPPLHAPTHIYTHTRHSTNGHTLKTCDSGIPVSVYSRRQDMRRNRTTLWCWCTISYAVSAD